MFFFPAPQTQLFVGISRDFCVFWVPEAAIGKLKETLAGIKVVYVTYHFRSVRYEKWSYYGYFIGIKPFLTATFLDIAVSRDFCVCWILEAARGKFKEIIVGIKVVYDTDRHLRSVSSAKWSFYGYFIAVKPFLRLHFWR